MIRTLTTESTKDLQMEHPLLAFHQLLAQRSIDEIPANQVRRAVGPAMAVGRRHAWTILMRTELDAGMGGAAGLG
jgi:hypothetical protein